MSLPRIQQANADMASAGGGWSNLSRRCVEMEKEVRCGKRCQLHDCIGTLRQMIDLRVGQADKQKRRRRRRRKRRHAHVVGQRLSVVANTKFGILMRWALFLEPLRSRSCFHFADLCGHCRLRHRIVIVFGIFMANRRTNFYVLFTKSLFLSLSVSQLT